jgi:phospholipid/cholesterol/gamma-HCH transport system permease protein
MTVALIAKFGAVVTDLLCGFGDFCRFCARTFSWIPSIFSPGRNRAELYRQCYLVGTRSVMVMIVTGIFVGAVLAVQTAPQFRAMGMLDSMGAIINLSVLCELGPILAGIMLAGRVGGRFTAELGTMRVTEQIDALRAMGADPIRVLVVPRFLACVMLIPLLVFYASIMGILGGYIISVELFEANAVDFWEKGRATVAMYDIVTGPIKCLFFGGATALICCYMGFRSEAGAAGVGHACTKSFVSTCMAILVLDFFLAMVISTFIEMVWGIEVKLL